MYGEYFVEILYC